LIRGCSDAELPREMFGLPLIPMMSPGQSEIMSLAVPT